MLVAGERRREPGSRQQNSSLLQLESCAQRSPSPSHKWVLDSTHVCPAPAIPPLTQPHLLQTWKRQGTANPPRQKTRSQYLQQLWNTTTRWVGGWASQLNNNDPHPGTAAWRTQPCEGESGELIKITMGQTLLLTKYFPTEILHLVLAMWKTTKCCPTEETRANCYRKVRE